MLPEIIRSPQCLKVQMSARSTPRMSAITVTGRGTANSGIRSTEPRSINASISSVVISRICGSSARTLRGLSALLISLRCRVCSGGSAVNSALTMGCALDSISSTSSCTGSLLMPMCRGPRSSSVMADEYTPVFLASAARVSYPATMVPMLGSRPTPPASWREA